MNSELERRKNIILEIFKNPNYKPLKFKELAALLNIPKDDREKLRETLVELMNESKIIFTPRGKYMLYDKPAFIGTYMSTTRGFGFVKVEGRNEDIFIPERGINTAMDKDEVEVTIDVEERLEDNYTELYYRKAEGHITKIIKRANLYVVGTYKRYEDFGFVVPDNRKLVQDIYIENGDEFGATNNQKVLVELISFGSEDKKPEGKVTRILGNPNEKGVDILSIAMAHGYETEFPQEVLEEAEKIALSISKEDEKGRTDFRDKLTVTIDGEDAKDLDDAISLERKGEHWILGVHIADVSHYVKENSYLDKQALERGTSVYLVDRVIPMLPTRLSNGICSLNAGEDRLALSCIMEIDDNGEVVDHSIKETIIRVDYRMTYTDVNALVTDSADQELIKKYESCIHLFNDMKKVSELIRERRYKRGAIDFDFPESKVILDDFGKVKELKFVERNTATKIIEDFMLCANETVAEEYFWLELPFLYRVHENPDPSKMTQLAIFINNFGFTMRSKSGEVHPKELQKLLSKIENSEFEAVISNIMLRSMKQARYQTECVGHFGLSAKYYTHFTSPIRRYPDLQIHRIIKENLKSGLTEKRIEHYINILDNVAYKSSTLERKAEETERDSIKYKKCEYMENHLFEKFNGIISGVTNAGFYVTLSNGVEGLVRMRELFDDYYNLVEEEYKIVGEEFGKTYRIGQKIEVAVIGADKDLRTIDLTPTKI